MVVCMQQKEVKMKLYKAFTLAEIMIVLVIIGVLSAILLPVAIHSVPDENIMKFKKGNNTLGVVIRELVNSDQYYLNGDLGTKVNGDLVDGKHDGDNTYFCETFADMVSVKKKNCSEEAINVEMQQFISQGQSGDMDTSVIYEGAADSACKTLAGKIKEEIVLADGIVFYQTAPNIPFGINFFDQQASRNPDEGNVCPDKTAPCAKYRLFDITDNDGFIRIYKIFCMDVDGINQGEDPFGYGIRVDGKIFADTRARAWLKKSVQKGE